jgi:hypothetical protein
LAGQSECNLADPDSNACLIRNAESQDAVTVKIVAERRAGKWYSDSARRESVGRRLAGMSLRARRCGQSLAISRLIMIALECNVTSEIGIWRFSIGSNRWRRLGSSRSAGGNRSPPIVDRSICEFRQGVIWRLRRNVRMGAILRSRRLMAPDSAGTKSVNTCGYKAVIDIESFVNLRC